MAYKFQTLAAKMSGSLTQEGDFAVHDHSGTEKATIGIDGAISGSGGLSAGGNLLTAGTVKFTGLTADTALDVAADGLFFNDGRDGTMKNVNVGSFMTDIAGDGIQVTSNQLVVGVDDSTIETDSDAIRLKDDGVTGAKLAPAVAAGGLTQDGSGNLQVGAGSLIDVQADQVDVDLTEAAAATIANGDHLIFLDGGATGAASKGSTADLAALLDGDGLARSNSTLSVAVSGAIHISSDKVSITGSFAGDCLSAGPTDGVDSIASLQVVADESTIEAVGRSSLRVKAAGITATQLATSVAGDGLTGGGGSALAVGVDDSTIEIDSDALRLKDDGVTGAKLAPAVAGAGLGQDGSGNLDVGAATNGGIAVNANDIGLDLNDLTAAAVDVSADSIAIIDAGDSNNTKKESIADLVTGMAGSGLAATNGVLSVQGNTVTARADGQTLTEGYNIFADLSSNATVTLPSGSLGDVVVVKAKNLTSGANILISPSGSQEIDGLTGAGAIRIESPFGAVTLVYVQANDWRIV